MPADLSVVIVTFNSADVIAECIRSIVGGTSRDECPEVIVVDNASCDGTADLVAKEFPDVILLRNDRNFGFAAAVNEGAARATRTILLLLNPDTVLPQGAIAELMQLFPARLQVSVAGYALVDDNGVHQPSCWKTPTILTALAEAFMPHRWSLPLVTESPRASREVPMVSGACMAVRRGVFQTLNGLDERFFMYYEDADFCLRVRQSGRRVFYLPGVRVVHHVRKSTASDPTFFFRQVYQSKMLFFWKHYSRPVSVAAALVIVGGILLRVPVYAAAGALLMKKDLIRLSKYHGLALVGMARELKEKVKSQK